MQENIPSISVYRGIETRFFLSPVMNHGLPCAPTYPILGQSRQGHTDSDVSPEWSPFAGLEIGWNSRNYIAIVSALNDLEFLRPFLVSNCVRPAMATNIRTGKGDRFHRPILRKPFFRRGKKAEKMRESTPERMARHKQLIIWPDVMQSVLVTHVGDFIVLGRTGVFPFSKQILVESRENSQDIILAIEVVLDGISDLVKSHFEGGFPILSGNRSTEDNHHPSLPCVNRNGIG